MIRYTIALCAFLAFIVALYGTYTLYAYRTSMQETESNIELPAAERPTTVTFVQTN